MEPNILQGSVANKTEATICEQDNPEEVESNEQCKSNESEITSRVDDEKWALSEELRSKESHLKCNVENQDLAVSDKCDAVEEPADQINAGSDGESLTLPPSTHDTNAVEVTADMHTPERETCALPTKVFSCEKPIVDDLETDEMRPSDEGKENGDKDVRQGCDEESKPNELVESTLPVQMASELATAPAEAVTAVEEENISDREKFCDCLRSLKELASPEVLQNLSSEEIFEAHHNLTEVMSVVVQALRGRWQSPRSKK